MSEQRDCASCGATADVRTLLPTSEQIVGEPTGWGIVTVNLHGQPVRSFTLCGGCTRTVRLVVNDA